MQPPQPVDVLHLFPEERAALLDLISKLSQDEWERPTACAGWSVHDVVLHVLGGDLAKLSRGRDGFMGVRAEPGETVLATVNRLNDEWVRAARRLSPRVATDLLAAAGPPLFDYFASLDLSALGERVSWAGPGSAPVWLDVAREYTEHWHHQQHVRDAVGMPGLTEPRYLAPVIATFVHALPHAYRDVAAAAGTAVQFLVGGEAGGDWSVVREGDGWRLYQGAPARATARVGLDAGTAWRLFTKIVSPQEAALRAELEGDPALAEPALHAIAIIA